MTDTKKDTHSLPSGGVSGHDTCAHFRKRGFPAHFAGFVHSNFAEVGVGVHEFRDGQNVFKEGGESPKATLTGSALTAREQKGNMVFGIQRDDRLVVIFIIILLLLLFFALSAPFQIALILTFFVTFTVTTTTGHSYRKLTENPEKLTETHNN
jgi:hypothetical protein